MTFRDIVHARPGLSQKLNCKWPHSMFVDLIPPPLYNPLHLAPQSLPSGMNPLTVPKLVSGWGVEAESYSWAVDRTQSCLDRRAEPSAHTVIIYSLQHPHLQVLPSPTGLLPFYPQALWTDTYFFLCPSCVFSWVTLYPSIHNPFIHLSMAFSMLVYKIIPCRAKSTWILCKTQEGVLIDVCAS